MASRIRTGSPGPLDLAWTLVLLPWGIITVIGCSLLALVPALVMSRALMHWWVTFVASRVWPVTLLLPASGRMPRVHGTERFPMHEPLVVVSNHVSNFDVPAMMWALPRLPVMVAKKEVLKVPFLGWSAAASGAVFVDRGNNEKAVASLRAAGERMRRENLVVGIYPEGTRSVTGRLKPFKKGAAVLALEAGVRIVPMFIHGTHMINPAGSVTVRPGPIDVYILDPVDPADFGPDGKDALLAEVHRRMAAKEAELEGAPPAPPAAA